MKLYASVTSERATKGQGGNRFIDIVLTDENREPVFIVQVRPLLHDANKWGIYLDNPYGIDSQMFPNRYKEIETKGKKKKDEAIKMVKQALRNNGIDDSIVS